MIMSKLTKLGGIAQELEKAFKEAQAVKKGPALPLNIKRAAPKTKQELQQEAERVSRQMMGEHVTSGKKGDTKNLAGRSMKEAKRVKGLDYKLSPAKELPEVETYTPEIGEVKMAIPGDQTISDQILETLNDLEIGSTQEGGSMYGLGKLDREDPLFWASNEGPAQQLQNKATALSQYYNTDKVLGEHLAMGNVANNFAMHMADANLKAFNSAQVHPAAIDKFNEIIRNGYQIKNPKTGEYKVIRFDEFPGIENPNEAYLAMMKDPELRKFFNARAKTPSVTEPLGLPNGLDVEYAVTEPILRDMEINLTGASVGRMKPGAKLTDDPDHDTYLKGIPGEFLGTREVLTPFKIAYPDATDYISATQRPQDFTGTIQKVFPHQKIDQQYLDEYNTYRDFIKKYTGKAKGGKVDMEAEFKKADTIGMAEGGSKRKSPHGKGSERTVTPPASFPDMSTLALTGKILARKGKEQLKKELANPSPQMAVDILGNLAADIVGMPSDLIEGVKGEPINTKGRNKPYNTSTMQKGKGKPMLGSENLYAQLKNAGITSGEERPLTETALGLISPAAIAKAPKLLKAMENLPVGLSIKDVSEGAEEAKRVANFVSSVEKTIKGHKMDSMPGEQWANWMRANASKSAKKEAEATGLYEWLKTQPKATKADIEAYVEGNLPKINVVEKGDLKLSKDESKELDTLKEKANKYMFGDKDAMTDDEFLRYNRLASIYDESTVGGLNQKAESYFRAARDAKKRGLKIDEIHGNNLGEFYKRRADALNAQPIDANKAKFASYTLPGGKNYKETMLTLPPKPMSFEEYVNYNMPGTRNPENYREDYLRYLSNPDRNSLKENFRSGHYDEPNILAHLRANERLTPDQKRVLFLEELQSDWAQRARDQGFLKPDLHVERRAEIKAEMDALAKEATAMRERGENPVDIRARMRQLDDALRDIPTPKGVPSAPYLADTKDWTALGLRHALKKAVDEGQDYLAWTTGAQQADRYNLAQHIDDIHYVNNGDGTYTIMPRPKGAQTAIDEINGVDLRRVSEKDLPNVVGKEVANKIINEEGTLGGFNSDFNRTMRLDNVDLQIGGEGMKGYYDQIVPQTMNDILKQYGVKDGVKEVGIELHPSQIASDYESLELTGRSPGDVINPGKYSQQMGIEITPELRERILSEGLPHFKRGGQPKRIDLETQFRLADILTR